MNYTFCVPYKCLLPVKAILLWFSNPSWKRSYVGGAAYPLRCIFKLGLSS